MRICGASEVYPATCLADKGFLLLVPGVGSVSWLRLNFPKSSSNAKAPLEYPSVVYPSVSVPPTDLSESVRVVVAAL